MHLLLNAIGSMLLAGAYQYVPFRDPAPLWNATYLLLLPLCIALAVVYKSIKCHKMSEVPREAIQILLVILGGIILAAVLLALLMRWLEKG